MIRLIWIYLQRVIFKINAEMYQTISKLTISLEKLYNSMYQKCPKQSTRNTNHYGGIEGCERKQFIHTIKQLLMFMKPTCFNIFLKISKILETYSRIKQNIHIRKLSL